MAEVPVTPGPVLVAAENRPVWRAAALAVGALVAAFAVPLWHWIDAAWDSELYSHTLLIPLVALYLGWTRRDRLAFRLAGSPALAAIPALLALGLIGLRHGLPATGTPLDASDVLALQLLAFVAAVWAVALALLGGRATRVLSLPLTLLVFLAPFPSAVEDGITWFLQHGSAPAAYGMFRLAGTSAMLEGLTIWLPGLILEVAPQCSGIHSTLVLFITSIVAADLFLRRPWKKAVLVFAVIPLALLRNGFRVFVLGEIAVHWYPDVLHSALHKRGGPIFFALSLIPLFLLLYLLWRSDRRAARPSQSSTPAN